MWLNNEEPWYRQVVMFVEEHPQGTYADLIDVLRAEHIIGELTPDGVSWTDPTLDHDRLNEMLREHMIEVGR